MTRVLVDNRTSLPLAGVRDVVRWTLEALETPSNRVTVLVRWTDWWHHFGRFHTGPRLIEANLPTKIEGELYQRGLRGGPPPIDPRNWEEALVCIVAHEGTHLAQLLAGPRTPGYERTLRDGRRIFVSGRQFSEVEAEWAEYRILQRWREEWNHER